MQYSKEWFIKHFTHVYNNATIWGQQIQKENRYLFNAAILDLYIERKHTLIQYVF